MRRKKIKSSRYLAAFLFTVVIFLVGYILGTMISDIKLQKVYDLEHDIRVESLGNELVFQLVQQDLCDNINVTSYTQELTDIGKRLTYMETLYGHDASNVRVLKSYYTLLQIRHWMIVEEANEKCGLNSPSVLFFYTNDAPCGDCEDQGLVLTSTHKEYSFFHTYSFELNQKNPAFDFLKERYDIQQHRLPTLVIGDDVFYGFQSKDFLIEHMELESKLSEDIILNPWRYE